MVDPQILFDAAMAVRKNAHAPYSKFQVGAAIEASDGSIHSGCNVENAAYPEGTCAEAGAIAAMVAVGGAKSIVQVVVVAGSKEPVTPCGGCRQKLAEFCSPNTTIHLANLDGIQASPSLGALFPGAFSRQHLE